MANVYAGYLSSLEKEAEIMFLEQEAEERKIQALMDLHEAALEAKYLEAEAMVLRENGSADDLLLYYREAEEAAGKDKPGIIRKTIDFIRNQISKFLAWLSKVTGKNDERLGELDNQSPNVSKSHCKIISMILGAWDTIHNKLNEWYNQLSTRKQEVLSLGTVTFATFGLKDLMGSALDKLKNDTTTEQQDGKKISNDTKKARDVSNILSGLCDKFNKLLDTFKTTAQNAHADAVQSRINAHQNKNNKAAEVKEESVSFGKGSLFGDLYYEQDSLPKLDDSKETKTEEKPAEKPVGGQQAKPGDNSASGTPSGSGAASTTSKSEDKSKPKAGERKVEPVAPTNGAETATKDDLNFADKAIIVVESIIRFISSLIKRLTGSIVELMKQCFSSIFSKDEKSGNTETKGEKTDSGDSAEANAESETSTDDDSNGGENPNQEQPADANGGTATTTTDSVALDLFGMDLDDTVTVTEDVMDELAELLCDI